jgi:subtilisin family serine protease
MKAIRLVLFVASICCLSTYTHAKDSYYYYNGERISLTLSDDSVSVFITQPSKNDGQNQHSYSWNTIASKQQSSLANNNDVTSVEFIITGDDSRTVKMSNRFYVQLYDSIRDVEVLQNIARATHTIILGQVPYMPDWYELVIHHSTISNSLEMSNYFYETGLFKNIDPGFIFDFSSSVACVTDSQFSEQWGMQSINACNAWDITTGSSDVKIAIIDKGVYRQHVEYSSTQFVDYYNCNTHTSSPYLIYGDHGTFVCGVIASNHNYAKIAGIAPDCKIMPISFYEENTSTVAANLASGFSWAVAHGADVINCSWGDHHIYDWLHSSILESAIQDALTYGRDGKGSVVVFAAGNVNSMQLDYPAYVFPDIITVGAMKEDSTRWESSSWGLSLDVVAPGHHIKTTDIDSTTSYNYVSGTSLAAPHVSGIAGLMLSVNPYLTQREIGDIIESTAKKVPSVSYYQYEETMGKMNGKWSYEMGYGLVDAYTAVYRAKNAFFRGPKYVCDTAKYYLVRPSLPNETIAWSVYNAYSINPLFSIVGPNNQDTVTIACDETIGNLRSDPLPGMGKTLSVTITKNGTSETYTKLLQHTHSVIPAVTVSNSSFSWITGTSRTFTITNCGLVPDSLLQWTVKKTVTALYPTPHTVSETYSYFYGHTLVYAAPAIPSQHIVSLNIYATNLAGDCGAIQSDTLHFAIRPRPGVITLLGSDEGEELAISLLEENEDSQRVQATLNDNSEYTLELWHSIYGRVRTQPALSPSEQMDILGLPQGTYILLLKENGDVIAQTKVIIQ